MPISFPNTLHDLTKFLFTRPNEETIIILMTKLRKLMSCGAMILATSPQSSDTLPLTTHRLTLVWVGCLTRFLFPFLSFLKDFIYLFLERGEGKERGKETSMCCCFSSSLNWGPGLQPRHVPWLGIKPATLWFTGPLSICWVTPARVDFYKNVQ